MAQHADKENSARFRFLRCYNKKLEKIMWTIFGVATLLEAMVQIPGSGLIENTIRVIIELVSGGTKSFPFILSSDYLNEVFSATCTIAVLGNAILSLLFGVYDKKTLGVPFQDVLNHSMIGDGQKYTIQALTVSVIFAVVWYMCGLYNLLFSVLIQNAFLLLFSCDELWSFLSDKETQRNTITQIVKKVDASKYPVYVDNWFKELDKALVPNNKEEAQEYFDLFGVVMETAPDCETQIRYCVGRHIQDYFNSACDKLGFVEAFELLRKVSKYAPVDFLEETQIAMKYLERLKLKDQVDIVNSEITDLVNDIFGDDRFTTEDKAFYAYQYFCAVFYNVQMLPEVKEKQLTRILRYLCSMREEEYGIIKAKVIPNIIKYDLLYNEKGDRERLFCTLIESLKRGSHSSDKKYYLATICEIYRAFFFVVNLEAGTLTDKYRTDLLSLFRISTSKKDLESLSFAHLVVDQINDVVVWLAHKAASANDRSNSFWEYYGLVTNWKRVVWTQEAIVQFSFCIYHLFGVNLDTNPFETILESGEYSNQEKRQLCKIILQQYSQDDSKDGFTDEMHRLSQQIADFTNIKISINNPFWKYEHSYYQEKMNKLDAAINERYFLEERISNNDLWKAVQNLFGENGLFVFDCTCSIFPGVRYSFKTDYVDLNEFVWKNAPKRISEKIYDYLIEYLLRELAVTKIDYSQKSINNMLHTLLESNYCCKNLRNVDHWRFDTTVRNSNEFMELTKVIKSIPCTTINGVREGIFLKKNRVPFNFYLQYNLRKMTEEECSTYVSRYGRDDIYTVNGIRFDYSHAIDYASNNMLAEDITIFIRVGIESSEGFVLVFE